MPTPEVGAWVLKGSTDSTKPQLEQAGTAAGCTLEEEEDEEDEEEGKDGRTVLERSLLCAAMAEPA